MRAGLYAFRPNWENQLRRVKSFIRPPGDSISRAHRAARGNGLPHQHRFSRLKDLKRNSGHDQQNLHGCILQPAKGLKEVKSAYVPPRKNHDAHRLARNAARERAAAVRHLAFEQQGALS